jgi:hypothetical protein
MNMIGKQVTYNNLDKYIEFEPSATVKSNGDHVVMICHDDRGVVCEDDNGAVAYDHDELLYEEDVEAQRVSYYGKQ